jgi:hypothetical protein
MIKDGPSSRCPETAMRDLLRYYERSIFASKPARPNNPPSAFARQSSATHEPEFTGRIGDWELSQDPETGDLIATNSLDGSIAVVARKGVT